MAIDLEQSNKFNSSVSGISSRTTQPAFNADIKLAKIETQENVVSQSEISYSQETQSSGPSVEGLDAAVSRQYEYIAQKQTDIRFTIDRDTIER